MWCYCPLSEVNAEELTQACSSKEESTTTLESEEITEDVLQPADKESTLCDSNDTETLESDNSEANSQKNSDEPKE